MNNHQLPVNPNTKRFFFGRISRDEAESVLKERGGATGLYLLRESMTIPGNYALSICHSPKIHHYSIERQSDGTVMIQDGRKFPGPIELIEHHKKVLDGFLTHPKDACERPAGKSAMAWPGVTMAELEALLLEKVTCLKIEGKTLEDAFGMHRPHLIGVIAKDLHRDQPWFHGTISRESASYTLTQAGHKDGKFLIREKDKNSYALSLSYKAITKHYKIEKHSVSNNKSGDIQAKLAIEDGPRFDCLMDMVAHYHNKTDGLLCKLTEPCIRAGFVKRTPYTTSDKNPAYNDLPKFPSDSNGLNSPTSSNEIAANKNRPLPPRPFIQERPLVAPALSASNAAPKKGPHHHRNAPVNVGLISSHLKESTWDDDPDLPEDASPSSAASRSTHLGDDPQKIYDSVPRTDEVFNLNIRDLELHERIGAGNFGQVLRGIYRRPHQEIPVAIKTLKQEDIPNAEEEIMKEARLMAGLQHRNIVRLIGICKSNSIMLILELAPLGQLNKYLKKHPELNVKNLIELMFQVAEGMAYLESKNFVHRDLAARNVLLVNSRFSKISDFGMSKALGLGNAYYKAETAGKWPLKWFAPECIYYFKFDSKSDVWSYGVTLWEAMSYGQKPYRGLKGQHILELIDSGDRLDSPANCPPGIYDIMLLCWQYEKEDRPHFKEIVEMLRKYK